MSLEIQIRKKLNNGRMLDVHFQGDGRIAVLGGTDSGKSVLLQCIAGSVKPDEGRIVLNGRVLFDSITHVRIRPGERKIGLLGNEQELLPNRTVHENIQLALRSGHSAAANGKKTGHHASREELMQASDSCLHEFHLDGLGGCYPEQLSAVQRIRAAAARMVASAPAMVLLDDPFEKLESYEKARLLLELRDQLDARKIPVLFATRDRNEAFAMAQQVLALNEGRSEPLETKQRFFTRPATISAALLAGIWNVTNVSRLNATHLVSQNWGMIFTITDPASAPGAGDPAGSKTFDNKNHDNETAGGKTASENVKSGDTAAMAAAPEKAAGSEPAAKNAAAEGAGTGHTEPEEHTISPEQRALAIDEEQRRRSEERRMRRREDLERSLRFELLPTEEMEGGTGPEQAGTGSAGTFTADGRGTLSLPAEHRWKPVPADVAAVGVRPDAFLTRRPAGPALVFRLHDRRIEEDAGHWLVYFHTFPSDRKSGGLRKGAAAGRPGEAEELLWEIPKSQAGRRLAETCRELYLPSDQLLLLKKG